MTPVIVSQPAEVVFDGTSAINFTAKGGGYTLSDAIVGDTDYINSLTPDQITAIQTERFNNWYTIITTPTEAPVDPVTPQV